MSFRIEEKISGTTAELHHLKAGVLNRGGRVLFPPRLVVSTYFDTPNGSMYFESEEGTLPRKKIRIRSYDDDVEAFSVETKVSSIEGRFKTSSSIDKKKAESLLADGLTDPMYGRCKATVKVTYTRSYYQLDGVRITFDTDIVYGCHNAPRTVSDPLSVMEIKAPFETPPDFLQDLVQERRRRFSKFSRACHMVLYRI